MKKISVLRLYNKKSPTSSPYVQFSQGFKRVESKCLTLDEFNGATKFTKYIRMAGSITKIVDNTDPNVIHCHNIFLIPVALLNRRKFKGAPKLVVTLHTSYYLLSLRDKIILRAAINKIDQLVCCGDSVKYSLPTDLMKRNNVSVVRNAIDLNRLKKSLKSDGKTKSKDCSNSTKFYTACRLVKGKGLDELIENFNQAHAESFSHTLDIYGDGPLRKRLERTITSNDKIFFKGLVSRDNLYNNISSYDTFISISSGEGMPIAPIEALSCGLNAILSDIPPHKELAELFPTQVQLCKFDATSLIEAIKTSQPKRSEHSEVNSMALREFSLEKMEDRYLEIYKN